MTNTNSIRRIALVLASYLLGSVSFAYLAGKLLGSVDLRKYGSRKLSASNVYEVLGVAGLIGVGVLDLSKGLVPTWLAIRLGYGVETAVAAGIAATVGHNWSCWLRLRGGRGLGTALGMLCVVFPWGFLWMLAWLVLSRLWPRCAAVPALIGTASLPFLACIIGAPSTIIIGNIILLGITILKRLEANREPLPAGRERWHTLWRRLWLDRDIADFETWVGRRCRQ